MSDRTVTFVQYVNMDSMLPEPEVKYVMLVPHGAEFRPGRHCRPPAQSRAGGGGEEGDGRAALCGKDSTHIHVDMDGRGIVVNTQPTHTMERCGVVEKIPSTQT